MKTEVKNYHCLMKTMNLNSNLYISFRGDRVVTLNREFTKYGGMLFWLNSNECWSFVNKESQVFNFIIHQQQKSVHHQQRNFTRILSCKLVTDELKTKRLSYINASCFWTESLSICLVLSQINFL